MGKKKFIDKKKSATFHLLARDTSDSTAFFSGGQVNDRVFVRVDTNNFQCPGFSDDDDNFGHSDIDEESDSIFADAVGDHEDDEGCASSLQPPLAAGTSMSSSSKKGELLDHVRREILELGLPDDGYNYLIHMREIKNTGGGSSYLENPKAKLDNMTLDVKAYDASRLQINSEVIDDADKDMMYAVASGTRSVKVQRVVDPDVLRLLDDSDLSRFGSEDEDFEEDFVVKANLPEEEEEQVKHVEEEGEEEVKAGAEEEDVLVADGGLDLQEQEVDGTVTVGGYVNDNFISDEKPRVRRFLDEQFDLLTLREYDNDSDDDDVHYGDAEREVLNSKLHDALKEFALDELEVEGKYKVPGDKKYDHQEKNGGTVVDDPEVIRRCVEYAEKYLNESQDDEEVFVEESSDESEGWDCETIVSTYSNLDNHPGRILAPENLNKKLPRKFPGDSSIKSNVIALRGKDKLPVDYLPNKAKALKVKLPASLIDDKPKRRSRSEESKTEKKERKAAVKEEKRESRRAKKELKGLYKCEGQKAQKVAAISGPSSIHIM
ncbi:protein LTV1 homolog [Zingiber officinale]|uniref:Low temperature viability protein n=1 Tax=Zingiber officinale TaxID=94328 RepID=A0A8J5HEE5_ZINOF|nr:protein LTV1 homolog [Zingiber officinale]XP_042470518.1 protein LTV1 homolog [Zingiber officinale]KAG6522401.1 hypothetical protein ZIOFF_019541 [Zingiber officinale]